MNKCEKLLFVPVPQSQQHPPVQRDSFRGRFHLPQAGFGKQNLPVDLSCFSCTGSRLFFPKKQRNKRSKGRSHVEIQSIHPSCHPRAIKLSYFLRRLKGHLISWKEGLMSQKMNELSASADNPWENNTCNVDLV